MYSRAPRLGHAAGHSFESPSSRVHLVLASALSARGTCEHQALLSAFSPPSSAPLSLSQMLSTLKDRGYDELRVKNFWG